MGRGSRNRNRNILLCGRKERFDSMRGRLAPEYEKRRSLLLETVSFGS